jgi:hypothetical protein
MALITDYDSLQAAVANHAWKSLDADYVAATPLFIQLAEADLNRKLRTREMLATVTLTPDESFMVTLPTDFVGHYSATALTSPRSILEPVTPEWADRAFPTRSGGWPEKFTIVGDQMEILPGNAADVKLIYYAALPALAFNATNWLLTKMPSLYLYAALAEGSAFLKDGEELPRWIAMRDAALAAFREADEAGMWNGARPQLGSVLP